MAAYELPRIITAEQAPANARRILASTESLESHGH